MDFIAIGFLAVVVLLCMVIVKLCQIHDELKRHNETRQP